MASDCYFVDKAQTQMYAAYRQKPPIQLIQQVITFLQEKYEGPFSLAVDVGCGSGQNTFMLEPYFQNVIGTDISQAQIEMTKQNETDKVKFAVSPAERIPTEPESVQLITACTALHWFDLSSFYKECERVLCKNGILAAYSYSYAEIHWSQEPSKDEDLNCILQDTYKSWGEGWAPQTQLAVDKYKDIQLPFKDFTRCPDLFVVERDLTLFEYANLLRSFSPFQNFAKAQGQIVAESTIQQFVIRGLGIVSDGAGFQGQAPEAKDVKLTERNKYFLIIARK